MNSLPTKNLILYKTSWCAHSLLVENYLKRNEITVDKIDIDKDMEAREELIRLNGGFASVPTLLFPDGSKLTEPSISAIRKKLNLQKPANLFTKIRALLGGGSSRN